MRGTIATGRKAWLFVGSDDHGTSAANHFSLVSSARLFHLDPRELALEIGPLSIPPPPPQQQDTANVTP